MTVANRTGAAPPRADALAIAGFTPFSTVDWPGKLAATVFLQGCPWRCGYCQNPGLMDPRAPGTVPWSRISQLLERRQGKLDAVVFSGGEPTRQGALTDAVDQARELGFKVGLHTSGAYPERLRELLRVLDWVALDIKAPRSRYPMVAGAAAAGERAWRSLGYVVESGIDHEIRTTVDPVTLSRADVAQLAAAVVRAGANAPILQEARAEGTLPSYAAQLGSATLDSVVPRTVLPHLERRYAH